MLTANPLCQFEHSQTWVGDIWRRNHHFGLFIGFLNPGLLFKKKKKKLNQTVQAKLRMPRPRGFPTKHGTDDDDDDDQCCSFHESVALLLCVISAYCLNLLHAQIYIQFYTLKHILCVSQTQKQAGENELMTHWVIKWGFLFPSVALYL